MANIQFSGITKRFGALAAVDQFNLQIQDGEFVALVGPSGCGKTTSLRMLAGLESPTSGSILLGEQDITHLPAKDRNLSMVFQNYALYPHLTVAQNIGYALKMRKMPARDIAREVAAAAALLGIEALLDRRPQQLSGGQRQRVAVCRAIVRHPAAFLFDEPLSNLDAKLRASARTDIRSLQRRLGVTTVYVTHDQVEAMTMADRVVVMKDGHIQQTGTPLEVYDAPANLFVAGFIGSPAMNLLPARCDAQGRLHAAGFQTRAALAPGLGANATLGLRPEDIRVRAEDCAQPLPISARLRHIEQLGNETLLHLELERLDLQARVPVRWRAGAGANVQLFIEQAALHVFNDATGLRHVA
jgi:ABC-type sugar transport system ATPase subunit